MTDLLLDALDPTLGRRAGLEAALRHVVLSGRVAPGTPLPSTRTLAAELGLARATVVGAYEQLVAEGYLTARQGASTLVADVHAPAPATDERPGGDSDLSYAFVPGEPDNSSFPRPAWLASTRAVLATAPDALFGYGDQRGHHALRTALAGYLTRSRAVVANADRIVTFGGYTSALAVLAAALRRRGATRAAMELPGLGRHRAIVAASGLEVVTVPVDDRGIDVDALHGSGADVVVTTPSHQYPLGVVLAPERRAALLRWARDTGRVIVEDDYDGEFRYDRQPVGALQGLDPERVVYAGTASKSLAAGIRIGWLVLPAELVSPTVAARFWQNDLSNLEQAVLAELIASGRMDRHVRRVRNRYRARRDALIAVLAEEAPWLDVVGVAAGLHVTALVPADGPSEQQVIAAAADEGLALLGLGHHGTGGGLVLGYSRPAEHEVTGALASLRAALRRCAPAAARRSATRRRTASRSPTT